MVSQSYTHTSAQCSPASVGLAQACPNEFHSHLNEAGNEPGNESNFCSQLFTDISVLQSFFPPPTPSLPVSMATTVKITSFCERKKHFQKATWTVLSQSPVNNVAQNSRKSYLNMGAQNETTFKDFLAS